MVHIDIPDFDGRIDPQVYSNWLATLEKYFDWYEMYDGRRVQFAIMKVVGQAQIWWSGVENQLRNTGHHIFNLGEMKQQLKRKYLPYNCQGNMTPLSV